MLCGFGMNHRDPYLLLLSSPFSSNFPPSKGPLFTSHVHQTLENFHVICRFCHIPLVITFFHVDCKNLLISLFLSFCAFLWWPGKLFVSWTGSPHAVEPYWKRLRHRALSPLQDCQLSVIYLKCYIWPPVICKTILEKKLTKC